MGTKTAKARAQAKAKSASKANTTAAARKVTRAKAHKAPAPRDAARPHKAPALRPGACIDCGVIKGERIGSGQIGEHLRGLVLCRPCFMARIKDAPPARADTFTPNPYAALQPRTDEERAAAKARRAPLQAKISAEWARCREAEIARDRAKPRAEREQLFIALVEGVFSLGGMAPNARPATESQTAREGWAEVIQTLATLEKALRDLKPTGRPFNPSKRSEARLEAARKAAAALPSREGSHLVVAVGVADIVRTREARDLATDVIDRCLAIARREHDLSITDRSRSARSSKAGGQPPRVLERAALELADQLGLFDVAAGKYSRATKRAKLGTDALASLALKHRRTANLLGLKTGSAGERARLRAVAFRRDYGS